MPAGRRLEPHEVHWSADEAHGLKWRESRRDACGRILAWQRRHLAGELLPHPAG